MKLNLALFFIFAVLCHTGISHHEMWRDELQAWSLVTDDGTLPAIFHDLHYEGHPGLWYLLLSALSNFTKDPQAMQWLQGIIACLGVWIFLRFCSLHWIYKALFIFGYYPLYEYGIKARGYALGILFVFVVCALWRDRQKHYPLIAILLFLLGQTSPMGIIMSLAMGGALTIDYLSSPNRPAAARHHPAWALTIFVAGIVAAIVQIIPPPGGNFTAEDAGGGLTPLNLMRAFSVISKTYLHTLNIFPSGSEDHHAFLMRAGVDVLLSATALMVFGLAFRKRKDVFLLYVLGNLLMIVGFAATNRYNPWHYGHLFILLIACVWINTAAPAATKTAKSGRVQAALLVVILICQVVVGIKAYGQDITLPYSSAQETAAYLKKQGLDQLPVIGDIDVPASAVAGYLGKPIYYPKSDRFGIHILWQPHKYGKAGIENTLSAARQLMEQYGKDVVLVLSYKPEEKDLPANVHFLRAFDRAIVETERFYVYRLVAHTQ